MHVGPDTRGAWIILFYFLWVLYWGTLILQVLYCVCRNPWLTDGLTQRFWPVLCIFDYVWRLLGDFHFHKFLAHNFSRIKALQVCTLHMVHYQANIRKGVPAKLCCVGRYVLQMRWMWIYVLLWRPLGETQDNPQFKQNQTIQRIYLYIRCKM